MTLVSVLLHQVDRGLLHLFQTLSNQRRVSLHLKIASLREVCRRPGGRFDRKESDAGPKTRQRIREVVEQVGDLIDTRARKFIKYMSDISVYTRPRLQDVTHKMYLSSIAQREGQSPVVAGYVKLNREGVVAFDMIS